MYQQYPQKTGSRQMISRQPAQWSLLLLTTLFMVGCGGASDGQGQQGGDMPPPPVTVATMELTSVDINEDYAGRIRGAREVDVRVRVDGVLQSRLHQEGQLVEEGDSLFQIDPEPFEVALQAADAQKQSAQADLSQAEREWKRVSRLYEQNAVSERERDNAQSMLEIAQATMAVAAAEVSRTNLDLSYTTVKAPVSGVTALETLSEGSLVDRGTMLTHITQLDPVHVRFALPEQDATVQRQARLARQAEDPSEHVREGTLILPGGDAYDEVGEIDFTASTVDPGTGTVMARAVFANPDQELVPGQFVRVRVTLETLKDIILVPEEAISDGADGLQVYVLDDEDRAHSRGVKTGRVIDGKRVILKGLEEGDRVVVNGIAAIQQDGMQVEAFESEEELEEAQEEQAAEAEADAMGDDDAGEEG